MKDGLGSIRTGIQGQGGSEVAAAGERCAGGGGARDCPRCDAGGRNIENSTSSVQHRSWRSAGNGPWWRQVNFARPTLYRGEI
jgi:hypothetical protein